MSNEILDFSSLEPQSVSFEYKGQQYVLNEATGDVARKFNNERISRITYGPDGNVSSIRDMGDLELKLVSMCTTTKNGDRIPETVVGSWPSRMVNKLYDKALDISGLRESETGLSRVLTLLTDNSGPVEVKELTDWLRSQNDDLINSELDAFNKEQKIKE